MERRVAVIGGSIAGLASAVALARAGWRATVIERDPAPDTDDGDEAFVSWERRNVPQFRQPHNFSARSRNLLLDRIPEVVDRLVAEGIEEVNLFKLLAPPELWSDEDDAYTGLWTRRPAMELALRRIAEVEPGVTIKSPAVVDGLVTSRSDTGAPPRVTGIRVDDGSVLEADMVLDCGGRRTPVPKWLSELGVDVPVEVQDCDSVYHSRYYRLRPDSGMSLFGTLGIATALDGLQIIGFTGDHDTFGLAAFTLPDDDDLKVLRHDWAWDTVMQAVPSVAPWVDPAVATPVASVQFMGGHQNVRRRYVVDGRPIVHGLLPAGDSLCTTNPQYGWGASMALTYAFAAVDAITSHGDPETVALSYDDAVREEADGVFRESAAMDRVRSYQWRNRDVPEWDRDEAERQDLIACVSAGALRDPVLGRAQLRRMNLLEPPSAVLDDPAVVERARHTQAVLRAKAGRPVTPQRHELLELLASAAPGC